MFRRGWELGARFEKVLPTHGCGMKAFEGFGVGEWRNGVRLGFASFVMIFHILKHFW